jgi:hypothetical protein
VTATAWARVDIPAEAGFTTSDFLGAPGGPQSPLPLPVVLVIDRAADGVYLLRYAEDGRFAGDTWHENEDDANEQAEYEYGPYLGSWLPTPEGLETEAAWVTWALHARGG